MYLRHIAFGFAAPLGTPAAMNVEPEGTGLKSIDSGSTWSLVGKYFLFRHSILKLVVDPRNPETVYAAVGEQQTLGLPDGRGIWKSDDTSTDRFKQINVSAEDKNLAYAVRVGLDHGNVLMTTNGGVDWTDISGNLPSAFAHSIAVDPRGGRDTLYVAIDGGVYVSADRAKEWRRFGRRLPNASFRTLDINTRLNVLVAGTYGQGAWRIRIDARGN